MRSVITIAIATVCANAVDIEVELATRFVSTNTGGSAFDRLARRHRLWDDLVTADFATPLAGYTVELVSKNAEYEQRAVDTTDDDEDDDDDDVAEPTRDDDSPAAALGTTRLQPGSADVELSERQAEALPYRLVREIRRGAAPLATWRELVSAFPNYRGALAGPMPKRAGAALLDEWHGAALPVGALWVQGREIETRQLESSHLILRRALEVRSSQTCRSNLRTQLK